MLAAVLGGSLTEGTPTVEVGVGGEGAVASNSGSRKLQLIPNICSIGGRIAIKVTTVASFGKVDEAIHLRHLIITFEAHQKFATLSSKRPRENGNILCNDCARTLGKAWKMKGAKRTKKEMIVVPPIFARWTDLDIRPA